MHPLSLSCTRRLGSLIPCARYSTAPIKTHVLLVGGGVGGQTISRLYQKHVPEIAEYFDMQNICKSLEKNHDIKPENISVLFGKGEKTPQVLNVRGIKSFVNLFLKKPNHVCMPELPYFSGGATFENLQGELERLTKCVKKNDRLWIVLSGHGRCYQGMQIWNEYFSLNVITPEYIQEKLGKFDASINISLFVSSCYSGQFLPLTTKNICVITSSNDSKVSYYTFAEGCRHFQNIFNRSCKNVPGLGPHSIEAQKNENYYASDSLTYVVDRAFEDRVGERKIKKLFDKIMRRLYAPYIAHVTTAAIIAVVILDETGMAWYLYNYKAFIAIAKLAPIVLKIGGALVFTGSYKKAEAYYHQSSLYKNSYIRSDLNLLRKIQNHNMLVDPRKNYLLLTHQALIRDTLNYLDLMKKEHDSDKPLTSYYYLYDKVKVFLSIATAEEIEIFIAICKNLRF